MVNSTPPVMDDANGTRNTAPCIIRTAGLTKAFGNLVAVNNLHLQVMRGDVFGFLGPNGSGKTTTIRMLLGLIQPTAGSIQLFGQNQRTHASELLPRIGAIVETPVFYPYLSGIDNLRTLATSSGMVAGAAREQRIQEILTLVDLQRQSNDAYRKYSLGMKQRLGIGAALLTDPELVLLDEPTNGLDPVGVHEIRQLIVRLAELGKTIFISSHILYEIQQVCNRVAIMQRGNLIKQGTVNELIGKGEQIILRLNTLEETRQAEQLLRQANAEGASWINHVAGEMNRQNQALLRITAPAARSSEITALLAQHQLYVAEIAPYQANLEEVFLELMNPAPGEPQRPNMINLASGPGATPATFPTSRYSDSEKRDTQ